MTIPQLLDRAVVRHGSRDAAVFVAQQQRLSWYDLQQQSDNLAAALLALGIRRGNRVGIWAPNRLEWLLTLFAAARIGAVLVNINPACNSDELEQILNSVRCRLLVMSRGVDAHEQLETLRQWAPEIDRPGPAGDLVSLKLAHLKHVVVLDDVSWPSHDAAKQAVPLRALRFKDFLKQAGPAQHARLKGLSAALDPDDTISIQFTNHGSGQAKGVTLSHFSMVNNARFAAKAMALTHNDRVCIPVPLYRSFGMVLGALSCTAVGAAMVFPSARFDAAQTIHAVVQQQCTALHGEPAHFEAMLADADIANKDFSLLRTGIMAGASCATETMQAVVRQLNLKQITVGLGKTETSPLSFQSHVADPLERRVSSVGRIHPHVQAKVVDPQGRMVPVGTTGELCVRGYLVMRGYWENAAQTAEAIDEAGWLHTGDLATIDAQGYCSILGRLGGAAAHGSHATQAT